MLALNPATTGGKIVVTRNPIQQLTALIYAIIHVRSHLQPFRCGEFFDFSKPVQGIFIFFKSFIVVRIFYFNSA